MIFNFLKYCIFIVFLSISFIGKTQFYTKTQIKQIDSLRNGYEGDLYLDTLNKSYYIGLTHGELARLGNGIDTAFLKNDTLNIFGYIDTSLVDLSSLRYKYKLVSTIDVNIDFTDNYTIYNQSLTADTTFTFLNARLGHISFLKIEANTFKSTFPSSLTIIQGEYDSSKTNYLEIICIDSTSGNEAYWGIYRADFGSVNDITSLANELDDILLAKIRAESGESSKSIKVCPIGTAIPTSVVSYADGNIIYIKRNGQTSYTFLAKLDKHEIHTFNADQGDRIFSLYGESVVSDAFGTVAWPSLSFAGREFFNYVIRTASAANNARLFVISFDVEAYVRLEKNGVPYDSLTVPAQSVVEVGLDAVAEFYIESDQLIALWYVGNDNSSDAKPISPVASELIWWNTDCCAGGTTGSWISALYPNTTIDVKYRDGTSETATISPGAPFQLKYGGGPYQSYGTDGGARIIADGIISGANSADQDGNNGTNWLPSTYMAQHFVLPNRAQHISFVSLYEGSVKVYDLTDALVTTLNLTRGAAVSADQRYPAATKYTFNGGQNFGKGYSFEVSVPAHCVFDSNEGGFGGDETILYGGELPQKAESNIILKDEVNGNNVRVFISGGVIQTGNL